MKAFTAVAIITTALLSTVTQVKAEDCVAIAGKHLDPGDIYDTPHQCSTCPGQAAQPALCSAINRAMVPYWEASADVVTIPHRGYWGHRPGLGAAENTYAAAEAALKAGYRIIEIDMMLTGPDHGGRKYPLVGHYFSMQSVGGELKKAPGDYSPDELLKFKMRKRDQSLSNDPNDSLILFPTLLSWAAANQVLLMVDPKIPEGGAHDDIARIVAYVLDQAYEANALKNIAIKSTKTFSATTKDIQPFLDFPFKQYEGKFLWSPIVNYSSKRTQDSTLSAIDNWHAGTRRSKQVITYEIGLFNSTFWSANKFNAGGMVYLNLIDYVKKLTPLGKRSAVWSIDSTGDKGKLNPNYQWKLVGNTSTNKHGNPIRNISYELARHLAFNTDRPEWYDQMVKKPY